MVDYRQVELVLVVVERDRGGCARPVLDDVGERFVNYRVGGPLDLRRDLWAVTVNAQLDVQPASAQRPDKFGKARQVSHLCPLRPVAPRPWLDELVDDFERPLAVDRAPG